MLRRGWHHREFEMLLFIMKVYSSYSPIHSKEDNRLRSLKMLIKIKKGVASNLYSSMEDVRRFLVQYPPKSCSLDTLPTFVLREFFDKLLPFIPTMCNVSMQHGTLPESQKAAIVTPILKKYDLDPDDVRNYRPISNLTFLSKVIERIVASQLTRYLQENKLLPDHQSAYRQGHSAETALLKISLRHPGCRRFSSGNAPWTARPERGLRHCWSRHPPNKASSVVRCHGICIGLNRLIHPASKSIGQLPRSNFHTDTAAIRRATRISPWTTPVHPLHLRRDINCHITRCWSSLVRRRQSTLSPLSRPPINRLPPRDWQNASRVLSGGCDQIGWNWIRTKPNSRGLGPGNSWRRSETAVFTNWGTPHQIFNLGKESGGDIRSRTGNGPARKQHNKKLFLPAETVAIYQTIAHNGSLEDTGSFPHIKSCGLLQQHILRSHEHCPTKIAIRSQCGGQADHEHKEIRSHHACAQGSTSLASHSPTHHFQNCNLRSEFAPRPWPFISQSILHPHLGNRGQSPPSISCTKTPFHTSNQDTSLRAKKLPCLRTGRVELSARWH